MRAPPLCLATGWEEPPGPPWPPCTHDDGFQSPAAGAPGQYWSLGLEVWGARSHNCHRPPKVPASLRVDVRTPDRASTSSALMVSPSLQSHWLPCCSQTPGIPSPRGLAVGRALCSRVSFLQLSMGAAPSLPGTLLRWHVGRGVFPDLPFRIQAPHPLHDPNLPILLLRVPLWSLWPPLTFVTVVCLTQWVPSSQVPYGQVEGRSYPPDAWVSTGLGAGHPGAHVGHLLCGTPPSALLHPQPGLLPSFLPTAAGGPH